MRVVRDITIHLIDMDRWPMNPRTVALIWHLQTGGTVPPIHVTRKANGRFSILDGRHRVLAHRMLGLKRIKARFYESGGDDGSQENHDCTLSRRDSPPPEVLGGYACM